MSRNFMSPGLYDDSVIDDRNQVPLTIGLATIVMVWMLAFGVVSVSTHISAQSHHMATSAASIVAVNSPDFEPKPAYTVSTAVPASAATDVSVVAAHPTVENSRAAASSTLRRVCSACRARNGDRYVDGLGLLRVRATRSY